MLEGCLTQFLPVMQVVGVIGKAGVSIVATLDDVLGDAGQVDAGNASHALDSRCGATTFANQSRIGSQPWPQRSVRNVPDPIPTPFLQQRAETRLVHGFGEQPTLHPPHPDGLQGQLLVGALHAFRHHLQIQ